MIHNLQSNFSSISEGNKNYNACLNDLQALEQYTNDPKAVRLCVDSQGHFWTQIHSESFLTQVIQLITRLFFEKKFENDELKVSKILFTTISDLEFVQEMGSKAGDPRIDLNRLKKFTDKDLRQIKFFYEDGLKELHHEFSSALTALEIAKNAIDSLPKTVAAPVIQQDEWVLLETPVEALPLAVLSSESESRKFEPIIRYIPVLETIEEEAAEPVRELPVVSVRPKINYFKELSKLVAQTLMKEENALEILNANLRKLLAPQMLLPTQKAATIEKLKGMLDGAMTVYNQSDEYRKKEMALLFAKEIFDNALLAGAGSELLC